MDYEVVYIANGQLEADMVRLMLEASGVKVLMRGESAGAVYGLTMGPLGEVNLLVPENQVAQAKSLIEAMDRGDLERNLDEEPESEDQEGSDEDTTSL